MKDNDTRSIDVFNIPDGDDRGVSPVIGVILMVAITVILAAVIASFVLGFGSSVSRNVNAGATIDSDAAPYDGSASVTYVSSGNSNKLNISVKYNNSQSATTELKQVGNAVSITEENASATSTNMTVTFGGKTLDVGEEEDTELTIVVTAVKGETRTVVQRETVTI